jgi:zinc-ribbon domain
LNCSKCGAQVTEGSVFCGSCGASVGTSDAKGQKQFSQWWASTSALLSRDPVVLVVGIGALLLCLGAFLPWVSVPRAADTLGLQIAAGPVVFAVGAFLGLALVLARGGTPGAWSVVILVLSAIELVLIFQTMIHLSDTYEHTSVSIGAGLYVAMVGGFATASGGLLETMRILKK